MTARLRRPALLVAGLVGHGRPDAGAAARSPTEEQAAEHGLSRPPTCRTCSADADRGGHAVRRRVPRGLAVPAADTVFNAEDRGATARSSPRVSSAPFQDDARTS